MKRTLFAAVAAEPAIPAPKQQDKWGVITKMCRRAATGAAAASTPVKSRYRIVAQAEIPLAENACRLNRSMQHHLI